MKHFKLLKSDDDGFSFISATIILLILVMCIAFALSVFPVFIEKSNLDRQANQLIRLAEISGEIGGEETKAYEEIIEEESNYDIDIIWSKSGKIQIGESFELELKTQVDIGFGSFGSIPVNISSSALGVSEVYNK
mgnify:CR=1 FL=1